MQAFRRHRKHSVISCRLDARCSAWDGSLQASSTAWVDFFKMSRTLWKIVLGAVSRFRCSLKSAVSARRASRSWMGAGTVTPDSRAGGGLGAAILPRAAGRAGRRRRAGAGAGAGAGFRAGGHVNLNLHRPSHPAAVAPAEPAAGPPRPRPPRLSHSAPRQAPPRLAVGTGARGADWSCRARCCRCGLSSPVPSAAARRSERACFVRARTACARSGGVRRRDLRMGE